MDIIENMLTALPAMSLTNAEQIQRLNDFFSENAGQIIDTAKYMFLAGFGIAIVGILITFGTFKALRIFREMSKL